MLIVGDGLHGEIDGNYMIKTFYFGKNGKVQKILEIYLIYP